MNRWNVVTGLCSLTAVLALASAGPAPVSGHAILATATHPVPGVCPGIANRVPFMAYVHCLANAGACGGWDELCFPTLPPSVFNRRRTWLDLLNPSMPYHPLSNPVRFKCGCW